MSKLLRDRRGAFGFVVLLVVVVCALAAPLVTNGDPVGQHDIVATRFIPPLSSDGHGIFHPLGTDRFGRDVWTRLVYGARVSMGVGVLAVLISLAVGVVVGAVAGYCVVTVLGLTGWMGIARLVHGEVRSLAARPFVEGAVAVGARRLRILARHILPNALTPVIVAAALGIGNAIILEGGLSYLGLGVQAPTPSWGNMIASGGDTLVNAPWVATAPGLALVLVVIACTQLGDALRDVLDPNLRR